MSKNITCKGVSRYKKLAENVYAIYTCMFAIVASLVFGGFLVMGKSFLWYADGAYEHYTYLIYMGEFLRGLVDKICNGNFLLLLNNWDFSIAQGGDAITSLHYFALGDPLSLLAFFFNKENMHVLYTLLVVIRFWLVGGAFVFYSRRMGFPKVATLAGAFVYCFSGYALFSGVRHPFFLNPMIWLPVIAVGVEEILKRGKSKLFVFSIMMAALSNFYFLYSITILMAGYYLLRFLEIYRGELKKNLILFLKGIWRYCLGIIFAAPILLPVLYCLFNSARLNLASTSIPMFYDKTYYAQFFLWLIAPYNNNSYYTILEYSGIVLFCLIALYLNKGNWALKGGIGVCFIILWIPYLCYLMNGRAYISNRWTYGLAFFVSIAVVKSFAFLLSSSKKVYAGMFISVVCYLFAVYCVHKKWGETYSKIYFPTCIVIIVLLLMIFLLAYLNKRMKISVCRLEWGIVILTIAGIVVNSYYRYTPAGQNYIGEFVKFGEEYSYATGNKQGIELIENLEDKEWYRVEVNYSDNKNESVIENYNGTKYSLGLMPKYITEYLRELADVDLYYSHVGTGLDDRTYLEALAGVKYYVLNHSEEGNVPYGYTLVASNDNYRIYENQFAMPIGILYDKVISENTFEGKRVEEKQQILMSYLVLADENYSNINDVPKEMYYDIPYEIISLNDNAIISDGCIEVIKDNAEIELKFEGIADCETYLKISNMQFSGIVNTAGYIDVIGSEKNNLFNLQTPKAQWYFGFDDFFCNMGYSEEGQTTLKLKILRRGKYTFDEMKVICLPMEEYANKVEERAERSLEEVEINDGSIKGTIKGTDGEWLFLSIPYSTGWYAEINGEKVTVHKANYMYTAVELQDGLNTIVLKYRTPGLLEGIITAIGAVIIVSICTVVGRIRKKESQGSGIDDSACSMTDGLL